MACADFDRWLDEGMPEADAPEARAHAGACARCAAALEAALVIEAAFSEQVVSARAVPARAPEGFASSVLSRIVEIEAERSRPMAEAPSQPWWVRLLSDPVASVSITVATLTIVTLVWNPGWFLGLGGRLGAEWLAWAARSGEIPVNSTLWLAVFATSVPFVLWWVWEIGRKVERAMVLQMTRPGA